MTNATKPGLRVALCAILLTTTVVLGSAVASVNPIPAPVQGLLCGAQGTRDVIQNTSWPTGTCHSPTSYSHSLLTQEVCNGCMQYAFVTIFDETLAASQPTPPVPVEDVEGTGVDEGTVTHPVGKLEGVKEDNHPAGPRYCLYFTPEGGTRQLLQCVDPTSGVYALMPPFERELVREPVEDVPLTPPIEEGELLTSQNTSRVSYDLHVGYGWNDSLLHMQIGPGLVEYWLPINPDNAAHVSWWKENAHKTSLDIQFTLHVEGQTSRTAWLHWPSLGQVLAAQERNTP